MSTPNRLRPQRKKADSNGRSAVSSLRRRVGTNRRAAATHPPELLKSEADALSTAIVSLRVAVEEIAARAVTLLGATRRTVTCRTTGLVTREEGLAVAAREMIRADRLCTPLCLLIIDIDKFKSINDAAGHAAGDLVLARVAEQIVSEAAVRGRDYGIRLGGDELAVLLPNTDEIGGVVVADRIRQSAEALQCEPLPVRVSIGGTCRQAADTLETFIARADAALFRAKRGGRNQTVFV
jgi:diguanylate cyclase